MRPAPVETRDLLPARYYLRLAALLEELGVPQRRLLRRAGLSRRRLHAEGLSLAEVERLCGAALALAPDPDLGWRLGGRLKPDAHATLGHALLRAPSIDAALRLAARYFALLSPGFLLRYRLAPPWAELEVLPRLALGPGTLRLHLAAILAGLLVELEHLHGDALPPLEIAASVPPPRASEMALWLARHRCRFGGEGWPGLRVRLPAALALARRARVAPAALQAAERRLEAERERLRVSGGLGGWAAMMLREVEGRRPTQPELARLLGLSTRSFARGLVREGVSWRRLLGEQRMAVARRRLAEGVSVTALALELGYAEAASFSRAFRRTFGISPRAFRARQRAHPRPAPD